MQHHKLKGKPWRSLWLTQTRQQTKIVYLIPVCCLLLAGGLVSCSRFGLGGVKLGNWGTNVTKISDIQQNKDSNTTIYLQGQVAVRAPFLQAGAYKLQDATGAIWVLTNQTVPNVGDEVVIKGLLQFQAIPVKGQELGEVYVQEEQQLERKAGKVVPTQKSSKS